VKYIYTHHLAYIKNKNNQQIYKCAQMNHNYNFKDNKIKIKYLRVSGFRDEKTSILKSFNIDRKIGRERIEILSRKQGDVRIWLEFF
jgi:hypothetical protein